MKLAGLAFAFLLGCLPSMVAGGQNPVVPALRPMTGLSQATRDSLAQVERELRRRLRPPAQALGTLPYTMRRVIPDATRRYSGRMLKPDTTIAYTIRQLDPTRPFLPGPPPGWLPRSEKK
ncbi:MAG: hypothetical protein HY710_15475 [Candidatus Latescibacteria bacterium]|nr:hypothetical protein [Candidatus Latescibacterota bacterium]